jgi:hypothetical protein
MPSEVSASGSALPLLVTRGAAADSVRLSFEDLGAGIDGYGAYAGDIGSWYSHAGVACGLVPAVSGARREATLALPGRARYVLVTASNACAEGPSGADSFARPQPAANLDCAP